MWKTSYAIYFYKMLHQMYPDTSISSVNDILERIAFESSRLAHYNKKLTITRRKINTAVHLLLPGKSVIHPVSESTKAVMNKCNMYRFDKKRIDVANVKCI
ncbi:Histone H2B [Echinococcus granulosus]|uniref:Histone H2B n=1 Tax=Echinococcus granulosus TaxID=6210 RepID=W6UEM9_ECHGR|nr:Histone H2B [Echinococcus granulosus]EUB56547.1 Histone H2B [Echinococcus granulosus]